MDKKVEKIETNLPLEPKLIKVAAYCRVSTEKDAMLNSLYSQINYYSKLIQSHSEWKYCGVYADEAMTGTKESRKKLSKIN